MAATMSKDDIFGIVDEIVAARPDGAIEILQALVKAAQGVSTYFTYEWKDKESAEQWGRVAEKLKRTASEVEILLSL